MTTIGDNKPVEAAGDAGNPANSSAIEQAAPSKIEQVAKEALTSQNVQASAPPLQANVQEVDPSKVDQLFALTLTRPPPLNAEPEPEVKVTYEKTEALLREPIVFEEGKIDVRWATVEQFAKDKEKLPPIWDLKKIDELPNGNEREFIKKCLKTAEDFRKKGVDVKGLNLALYAWSEHADPKNRFLIIPVYEENSSKQLELVGCRILKSSNKHQKKNKRGEIIKIKGAFKVYSDASYRNEKGDAHLASLGVHVKKAELVDGSKKELAAEESHFHRVIGDELFVQTIYAISYISKKGKIKRRYFQEHAGLDLQDLQFSLSNTQKTEITKQLVQALQVLNGKGWIHRDLKLENVFFSDITGKIKIGDLATMQTEREKNYVITASCCSPEVASCYFKYVEARKELKSAKETKDRKQIDAAEKKLNEVDEAFQKAQSHLHDLWGLGCILWKIWTDAEFPWQVDTELNVHTENVFALNSLATEDLTDDINNILVDQVIPENIKHLIRGCLTRDPQQRFLATMVEEEVKLHDEFSAIKDANLVNQFLNLINTEYENTDPNRDIRYVDLVKGFDFSNTPLEVLNQAYLDKLDGQEKEFLQECIGLALNAKRPVYASSKSTGLKRYLLIPQKDGTVCFLTATNKSRSVKPRGGMHKVFRIAASGEIEFGTLSAKAGRVEDLFKEIKKLRSVKEIPGVVRTFGIIQYVSKKGRPKFRLYSEYHNTGNIYAKTLTENQKKSATKQLMETLAVFEERGLVHRDIKGPNILMHKMTKKLSESERKDQAPTQSKEGVLVSICDFGSLSIKDGKLKRRLETTYDYVSPELAAAHREYQADKSAKNLEKFFSVQDHKLDVWSMGIVFYEMWTGMLLPWVKKNEGERFDAIEKFEPALLERLEVLQKEHPRVHQLILKMLEKDPKKRPGAAQLRKEFPDLLT